MDNREFALLAAKSLSEKKAFDISVIDIAERSGFADYFVMASASSLRHMNSLSDELDDRLSEAGLIARNIEGRGESGWILMDYGDVIINIFSEEARDKYRLEKLWGDCRSIDFEEAQPDSGEYSSEARPNGTDF